MIHSHRKEPYAPSRPRIAAGAAREVITPPTSGVHASLVEYLHRCPICGCSNVAHYSRVPSLFNRGEAIRYEACRSCGVVFRNPRIPSHQRENLYADRIFSKEAKQLLPRNQIHYWFMMQALSSLRAGKGGRLLDFGCGSGGFLVEAQAAGFDVHGLELCRDLARHVEESYQIPVHSGEISDASFASHRFDVIISSMVFEHLTDPRTSLQSLRAHLEPSGLLLIEVPNLRDMRERLRRGSTLDDSHLFYFDRASLGHLLESCGLRVVTVHEGLRPYRLFPGPARAIPPRILAWGERVLSGLQIKTALSVVARAV